MGILSRFFLAGLLLGAADYLPASEPARFERLPLEEPATAIALTGDGRQLVVAHQEANALSVWSAETGLLLRRVDCETPAYLLSRDRRIFVATGNHGTVAIFDPEQDWKRVKDVEVRWPGSEDPHRLPAVFLSAPQGEHFSDKLAVVFHQGRRRSSLWIDIGTGGITNLPDNNTAWPELSYNGERFLRQSFFEGSPRVVRLLSDGSTEALLSSPVDRKFPRLHQHQPGGLWIGGGRIYREDPLLAVTPQLGRMLIADQSRNLVYALDDSALRAVTFSAAPRIVGSRRAEIPAWLASLEGEWLGGDMNSTRGVYVGGPRPPAAATVDDMLYLFTLDPASREVHRCATPAFEEPAEAEPPDDLVQPVPAPDMTTTIAMSEDGKYLVAAHQASNQLTVWETLSGNLLHTIPSPAPSALLIRRGRLYVAGLEREVIDVFDIAQDWALTDQVLLGDTGAYYLSAPQGRNFRGQIHVMCAGLRRNVVYKVDVVRETCEKVDFRSGTPWLATSNYAGTSLLEQRLEGQYSRIRRGGGVYECRGLPPLQQVSEGTLWIGGSTVYGGLPPTALVESQHDRVAIPDLTRRRVYTFQNGRIDTHHLDERMTRIGRREIRVEGVEGLDPDPAWMPGWSAGSRRPPHEIKPNLAATVEGQTVLYFFEPWTNRLLRYRMAAADRPPAQVAGEDTVPLVGHFPESLAVGRELRFQIDDAPAEAEFELVQGPDTVRIEPGGLLRWTPAAGDRGRQELKIKVTAGEHVSFRRYLTQIGRGGAPQSPRPASESGLAGRHLLQSRRIHLEYGHNYDSVLLLDGGALHLLDLHGQRISRTAELPQPVSAIFERENYYVALADNRVLLLDKQRLAPLRQIALPGVRATGLAVCRSAPLSFAAIEQAGAESEVERYRVAVIDERRGTARLLPDILAKHIAVDPTGRYLYTGLDVSYQKGVAIDLFRGNVIAIQGVVDLFSCYEIDTRAGGAGEPRRVQIHENPGGRGTGLRVSPDGRRISYLSSLGYHGEEFKRSNGIPIFDATDITRLLTVFSMPMTAEDLAFHPLLDIAAAVDRRGELRIFSTTNGRDFTEHFDRGSEQLGRIGRVMFTPGGRHLLVEYRDGRNQQVLQAFPLKLNPTSERIVAAGARPPQITSAAAGGAERPTPAVPPAAIDALGREPPPGEMTPQEIGRRYMESVVVVRGQRTLATGFVVGSGGYLLTSARALPRDGQITVFRRIREGDRFRTLQAQAAVVHSDAGHDLALLKIDTEEKLVPVDLSAITELEAGTEVVAIGHPGLGQTALHYTMTRGVVSNPRRLIDGLDYIQTDAAVNPGSSGSPLFDSRGRIVGLVVMKGNIESAGFAVPQARLLEFLRACTAGAESPSAENKR